MYKASKTFWDIEKEKTWRIYCLFAFLLFLYFLTVFIVWLFIKFFLYLRFSVIGSSDAGFSVFGPDTLYVLIIAGIAAVIHWYYSNHNVVNRILHLLGAKHPDKYDKYSQKLLPSV